MVFLYASNVSTSKKIVPMNFLSLYHFSHVCASLVRVKEEGCGRFWQTSIKIATLMDLKPTRNSLGHNPLSDALHWNPGVVING